ncbi:hypothetical protein GUITHDRAFT_108313 [Guillardia theta CCMP2712]|uniref:Uncharacterized protein n=1 Tax=Guillardia theta (strain CCMP2712) TaxID=905079 RepID=L1JBF5_GUITC|nr:hypothetical protein GUITHDRAFT_108313 [Guillardia theta CCMP2712]EKX45863.1 hypothetical protein GUITHDRAFT_108313 [Guillardia theta CCMP2712]|eukprot:XP_005832843.1 hypothetical protein GUITHDRAFT_108313 [Guillardia theta CCMP2712]
MKATSDFHLLRADNFLQSRLTLPISQVLFIPDNLQADASTRRVASISLVRQKREEHGRALSLSARREAPRDSLSLSAQHLPLNPRADNMSKWHVSPSPPPSPAPVIRPKTGNPCRRAGPDEFARRSFSSLNLSLDQDEAHRPSTARLPPRGAREVIAVAKPRVIDFQLVQEKEKHEDGEEELEREAHNGWRSRQRSIPKLKHQFLWCKLHSSSSFVASVTDLKKKFHRRLATDDQLRISNTLAAATRMALTPRPLSSRATRVEERAPSAPSHRPATVHGGRRERESQRPAEYLDPWASDGNDEDSIRAFAVSVRQDLYIDHRSKTSGNGGGGRERSVSLDPSTRVQLQMLVQSSAGDQKLQKQAKGTEACYRAPA